jgi:hypothetical protein
MMNPHNMIMFLGLGLANQGSDFNVSSASRPTSWGGLANMRRVK